MLLKRSPVHAVLQTAVNPVCFQPRITSCSPHASSSILRCAAPLSTQLALAVAA